MFMLIPQVPCSRKQFTGKSLKYIIENYTFRAILTYVFNVPNFTCVIFENNFLNMGHFGCFDHWGSGEGGCTLLVTGLV